MRRLALMFFLGLSLYAISPQKKAVKFPNKKNWRKIILRYLLKQCRKNNIDYPIAKNLAWHESRYNEFENEWARRRGRRYIISRGFFQISESLRVCYNNANKTKYSTRDLYRPFINIDIFIWNFSRNLKKYNSYLAALSIHFMGENGYRNLKKKAKWRNGRKYWRAVRRVEKHCGFKIKY